MGGWTAEDIKRNRSKKNIKSNNNPSGWTADDIKSFRNPVSQPSTPNQSVSSRVATFVASTVKDKPQSQTYDFLNPPQKKVATAEPMPETIQMNKYKGPKPTTPTMKSENYYRNPEPIKEAIRSTNGRTLGDDIKDQYIKLNAAVGAGIADLGTGTLNAIRGLYKHNRRDTGQLGTTMDMVDAIKDGASNKELLELSKQTVYADKPENFIEKGLLKGVEAFEQRGAEFAEPLQDLEGAEKIFHGAVRAIPPMVPALAAGPAGLGVLGGMAFGGAAREAELEGAPLEKQMEYASLNTLVELGTELLPFNKLNKILKGSKTPAREMVIGAVEEFFGEGIAESLGPHIKRKVYDPRAEAATWKQIIEAGLSGAVSSVLLSGVSMGLASAERAVDDGDYSPETIEGIRKEIKTKTGVDLVKPSISPTSEEISGAVQRHIEKPQESDIIKIDEATKQAGIEPTQPKQEKAMELPTNTNESSHIEGLDIPEYTIEKRQNTVTKNDMWVLSLKDKVNKAEFDDIKAKIKAKGGYYSRYSKGFVFKSDPNISQTMGKVPTSTLDSTKHPAYVRNGRSLTPSNNSISPSKDLSKDNTTPLDLQSLSKTDEVTTELDRAESEAYNKKNNGEDPMVEINLANTTEFPRVTYKGKTHIVVHKDTYKRNKTHYDKVRLVPEGAKAFHNGETIVNSEGQPLEYINDPEEVAARKAKREAVAVEKAEKQWGDLEEKYGDRYDLETEKDLQYESQYNTKEEIMNQISKYYENKGDVENASGLIEETFKKTNLSYPGRKIDDGGYGIIGKTIRTVLIEEGKVNFYGQKFKDVKELATLLQIFRNPKYETFRIIFVDDTNTIVGIDGLSSRLPNSSQAIIGEWDVMSDRMDKMGATKYYLMHNHPSGNPTLSSDDIFVSGSYDQNLKGYAGHIVINSNKYCFLDGRNQTAQIYNAIAKTENTKTRKSIIASRIPIQPLDFQKDKLLLDTDKTLWGKEITGPEDIGNIVKIAKAEQLDDDKITFAFLSQKHSVRTVENLPLSYFDDVTSEKFIEKHRERLLNLGATIGVAIGTEKNSNLLTQLIQEGFLLDAVLLDENMNQIGNSIRNDEGITPQIDRRGGDDFYGLPTDVKIPIEKGKKKPDDVATVIKAETGIDLDKVKKKLKKGKYNKPAPVKKTIKDTTKKTEEKQQAPVDEKKVPPQFEGREATPENDPIQVIKNQGGFIKLNTDKVPMVDKYKYADEDLELQKSEAKLKPKTFFEKLDEWSKEFKKMSTRTFRELDPKNPLKSEAIKELVKYPQLKGLAGDEATRILHDIIKHDKQQLTPEEFNRFERYVLLLDLREEAKLGHNLPGLWTDKVVAEELERLENSLNENIKEAVKRRKKYWEDVKDQYIENMELVGYDVSNRFQKLNYFRHMVLEYANAKKVTGSGSKVKVNNNRGFSKERKGSNKLINEDYLQAEYEVLAHMIYDTKVAQMLSNIRKNYDIKGDLKKAAREYNQAAKEANHQLVEEVVTAEALQGNEKLQEAYNAIKRNIALGFKTLRAVANSEGLPTFNGEYEDTVDALANGYSDDSGKLGKYLSLLTECDNEEAVKGALTIFKYGKQKDEFAQALLGDKYKPTNATWKDAIPEGYEIWQPIPGKHFFTANSISADFAEAIIEKSFDGLKQSQMAIREVMAMGGDREQFVLPESIAKSLDSVYKKINDNNDPIHQGISLPLNLWKAWVLTGNPKQVVKYNIRNATGDLDGVIAAAGFKAISPKYVNKATKDLYDVMKHMKFTPELLEWRDRGGFQSLLYVQEIANVNDMKMFRNFRDIKNETLLTKIRNRVPFIGSYTDFTQNLTNYRESILRYSTYLFYKEHLKANNGSPKFYGASLKSRIDGLNKVEDKAYQLSKDALGAYDELTEVGQVLRRYLIPFHSWNEVNMKRYKRIFQNTVNDIKAQKEVGDRIVKGMRLSGVTSVKAIRILGKTGIRVMFLAALLQAWNKLVMGDDDDKLPEGIQNTPHITLGTNSKGEVIYFSRLGALNDVMEWFGLDQLPSDIKDLTSGRKTMGEQAKQMVLAPVNKIVNSFTPYLKMPVEILSKRSYFPDFTEPRVIRDVPYYIAQSFGVKDEYAKLAGMPMNDSYLETWQKAFIYKSDPEVSAYYKALDLRYKFEEKVLHKQAFAGFSTSERSKALYYYKTALKYGDAKAAEKFLEKYVKYGGTSGGLSRSLATLDPLYGLDDQEKNMFASWLTDKELEQVITAIEYYNELVQQ